MSEKTTQRRRPVQKTRPLDEHAEPKSGGIVGSARGKKEPRPNVSSSQPVRKKTISPIKILVLWVASVVVSFGVYKLLIENLYAERTNVPVNLPKLVPAPPSISERFWGTYRSNLYFGLKHRSAQPLSGGLMWFDYGTLQKSQDRFLRHWCDQNDHLKYGWSYHDGDIFGIENITDHNHQFDIQWMRENSGKHGGDWTTRITVSPQV